MCFFNLIVNLYKAIISKPIIYIILFIIGAIISQQTANAQSFSLHIKDMNGNIEQTLKSGVTITAISKSDEISHGKLKILNDSSLLVAKDTIFLNSIRQLTVPAKSTAVGPVLITAAIALAITGAGISAIGLLIAVVSSDLSIATGGAIMMGSAIPIAIGAGISLSKKISYSLTDHSWSIRHK